MAYVLFMDIVGYSALRMEQQQSVLHRFQGAVRNSAELTRAQEDDQPIRLPTGDGMALVFFRDPEAPARCAIDVSSSLRNHPEVKLRMGIHAGPVYRVADINTNRNVAGGGINIAQRVMDCGDAGHILVSKAASDLLAEIKGWEPLLHDLGETEVKHRHRLHLFNLWSEEAGNRERPSKLRLARKSRIKTIAAAALAAVVVAVIGTRLVYGPRLMR